MCLCRKSLQAESQAQRLQEVGYVVDDDLDPTGFASPRPTSHTAYQAISRSYRLVTEVTDVGRVGARHDRTNDYRWLLLTQWLGRHEA